MDSLDIELNAKLASSLRNNITGSKRYKEAVNRDLVKWVCSEGWSYLEIYCL